MFKLKSSFIFFLTILLTLNFINGTFWSQNMNCQYLGTMDTATSFQCQFTSSDYNLKVQINQQIDLTLMDENSLKFIDNKIHFNHTQFNTKTANFTYSNLFTYNYAPVYLKNNIAFTPTTSNFDNAADIVTFTNVINNLENFKISKNSILSISTAQTAYFNTTVSFTTSYNNAGTNAVIPSQTCTYTYNQIQNPVITNSFNINFNTSASETFLVTCSASGYETITTEQTINTVFQPVDNFSVVVSYNQYENSPTVLVEKNLSVVITSDNSNNINPSWSTKYYLGLSWNSHTTNENLLLYGQWFEVGQFESFNLFADSELELTQTTIPNTNYSKFLFRNEKDGQSQDKSLILNIKSCSTNWQGAQNCKYNHSNYFIFKDLTPPNITRTVNNGYLNNNNNILFNYTVYDFESSIKSLKYVIIENGTSGLEPTIPVPNFNSNIQSTFDINGQNLDNGKYYQIVYKAENAVSVESTNLFSDLFLVDTFAPINATINLTLNEYDYDVRDTITIDLDPGFDYNINYTQLNLLESGLNSTKLEIKTHNLENNICQLPTTNVSILNFTTTPIIQTTQVLNLQSGNCYELIYHVYDSASNINQVLASTQIKVDKTLPTIIGIIDDNSNSQNYDFDESKLIFRTNWQFEDLESEIAYYNAYLYKQTQSVPKTLVKSFTNISQNHNYLDVTYNSTYIEDGAQYFVQVTATNKANLTTSMYETDGITLFEKVVPSLEITNDLLIDNNIIFDFINDGNTYVTFKDTNNLNITCRYYTEDVSYDALQGIACLKNQDEISCNFPTSSNTNFNNYYVSCLNYDQIDSTRNKNDLTNNYDVSIYLEYNQMPDITQINYQTYNFSNITSTIEQTQYNLLENESITFSITAIDTNVQNLYYNKLKFNNSKLTNKNLSNISNQL